ncbi:hypothetical protein ACH95_06710 [Bacillus glycinifermentans]|nr:hypothetical protein ACH95_06710 [Bacillus glycinifermentans]
MSKPFFDCCIHRQQDLKIENLKEKNQDLEETIKKLNQKKYRKTALRKIRHFLKRCLIILM